MHCFLLLTLVMTIHRYCSGLPKELVEGSNSLATGTVSSQKEDRILQNPTTMSEIITKFGLQKNLKGSTKAPRFTELSEFAGKSNGGQIIFATDDYFAIAENLIKDSEPVYIENKNTLYGKWMDGWETRRRRKPGHDWCIVQLAAQCRIAGILVDTAYFTGNFAPRISVQGGNLTEKAKSLVPHRKGKMGSSSSNGEMQQISQLRTDKWVELVTMTNLKPGTEHTRKNYFSVNTNYNFSFIRINIYPDGGIARLRLFGVGVPDPTKLNGVIDLIGMVNGGYVISYSNAYFGHPTNLIKKYRATKAGDGWETVRRLDRPSILEEDSSGSLQVPGSEWTIIKMSCSGFIKEIIVDSLYFLGNVPYSFKLEGITSNSDETLTASKWISILDKQKLNAISDDGTTSYKSDKIQSAGPFNYVKITIFPDGGISRLRLFGRKA